MLVSCNSFLNTSSSQTTNYEISDKVTVGSLQYVVESVEDTDFIGNAILNKTTDYNFAIVSMTVYNMSTSEISLYTDMIAYHIGENVYEPNSAGMYVEDGFYVLLSIGAKLRKHINIVYEVLRKHTAGDYLEVFSQNKTESAKIYLRETHKQEE